jgi:hypothetical protein
MTNLRNRAKLACEDDKGQKVIVTVCIRVFLSN